MTPQLSVVLIMLLTTCTKGGTAAQITGLAATCADHFGTYNDLYYNYSINPLACYMTGPGNLDYSGAVA